MMEWRDMDTEPGDHMPRLYLCRQVVVQGFVDVTGMRCVKHEFGWRKMKKHPSHWMPLPGLPKTKRDI